ncbi:hypothetical protein ACG7TL_006361 [Trametes sanguinea]
MTDALPFGEAPWISFRIRYAGHVDANSPSWKRHTYIVHMRNPLRVAENMAGSADFLGTWDYTPFKEFLGEGCQRYSNLMSGRWAYKQADTIITEHPELEGTMLTPIILGADKTTCSVATGHQSFHPVYISLGNIHNEMRRAHRDAVVPLAFLPIPTCAREHENDEEFRIFRKQVYHAALAQILAPLRPGMTVPHVMRCPDGHFRRAIFELGPFIADYPEQVYLSGALQGWCPKSEAHCLHETFTSAVLYDVFGVVADVKLIKGTFKDHLVTWVSDYIMLTADSEHEGKKILDEIDQRLAAAPPFPGLRRFPEGRKFSQWTGNDAKALMKVYLAAIAGVVPDRMVQCMAAFLDFCYIARRSSHDSVSLDAMADALAYFHDLRTVFVELGIRPTGFGLPRQHALVHYVEAIRLFGSPNGLCSSITESKHIEAVKRPWRASNKNEPLEQILKKNTRRSKLAAARVEYGRSGLLQGDVLTSVRREIDPYMDDLQDEDGEEYLALRDHRGVHKPAVHLATRPASTLSIRDMSVEVDQHDLEVLISEYLQQSIYPDVLINEGFPVNELPQVSSRTRISSPTLFSEDLSLVSVPVPSSTPKILSVLRTSTPNSVQSEIEDNVREDPCVANSFA